MELEKLRKKIDEVDRKILKLLDERASFVQEVGHLKSRTGQEFYIPHREKQIIATLIRHNKGLIPGISIEAIYREILNACRSLESRLKIAFFGPEATFTHQAALKNFGPAADYLPVKTVAEVFAEVEKGRADYGVVPIENSNGGVVHHTLDMFIESDLSISSEISMQIEQCLLAKGGTLKDVKKVYSHFQPILQCRNWLEKYLPGVPVIEVTSTSEASKRVAKEKGAAAIASRAAAILYHLEVIACGIEDGKENVTKFFVIGKSRPQPSGHDKTSLMFSTKDEVGALHAILTIFKKHGINLTKIESRPTKKKAWEYMFFVDFLGHTSDKKIQQVLKSINRHCVFVKVLGSYPRAE